MAFRLLPPSSGHRKHQGGAEAEVADERQEHHQHQGPLVMAQVLEVHYGVKSQHDAELDDAGATVPEQAAQGAGG